MFKGLIRLIFCCILFCSCSSTNNEPTIKFSADSCSIIVKGIKKADVLQLKTLLNTDSSLSDYFLVDRKPRLQDSLLTETNLKGRLLVTADSVVFTPLVSFMRGETYLVHSFIGVEFTSVGDLLKGKGKTSVQPQEQILKR